MQPVLLASGKSVAAGLSGSQEPRQRWIEIWNLRKYFRRPRRCFLVSRQKDAESRLPELEANSLY